MLKNLCRKLTQRAATIGAFGDFLCRKGRSSGVEQQRVSLYPLQLYPYKSICGRRDRGTVFVYDGAANIIYWHSCCVEISISVYHYHFPVSVVDEDAQRRSLRTVVRTICPKFRRTLLERERNVAGTCFRANLFEPAPRQGTVWVRVCTVFPLLGRYGIVLRRRLHESCLLF